MNQKDIKKCDKKNAAAKTDLGSNRPTVGLRQLYETIIKPILNRKKRNYNDSELSQKEMTMVCLNFFKEAKLGSKELKFYQISVKNDKEGSGEPEKIPAIEFSKQGWNKLEEYLSTWEEAFAAQTIVDYVCKLRWRNIIYRAINEAKKNQCKLTEFSAEKSLLEKDDAASSTAGSHKSNEKPNQNSDSTSTHKLPLSLKRASASHITPIVTNFSGNTASEYSSIFVRRNHHFNQHTKKLNKLYFNCFEALLEINQNSKCPSFLEKIAQVSLIKSGYKFIPQYPVQLNEFFEALHSEDTVRASKFINVLYMKKTRSSSVLRKRAEVASNEYLPSDPATLKKLKIMKAYTENADLVLEWICTVLQIDPRKELQKNDRGSNSSVSGEGFSTSSLNMRNTLNLNMPDLVSFLSDGTYLFKLVCEINSYKKYLNNLLSSSFAMHRIFFFLESCREIDIPKKYLFALLDPFVPLSMDPDCKHRFRVLRTLSILSRRALAMGYGGPYIDHKRMCVVIPNDSENYKTFKKLTADYDAEITRLKHSQSEQLRPVSITIASTTSLAVSDVTINKTPREKHPDVHYEGASNDLVLNSLSSPSESNMSFSLGISNNLHCKETPHSGSRKSPNAISMLNRYYKESVDTIPTKGNNRSNADYVLSSYGMKNNNNQSISTADDDYSTNININESSSNVKSENSHSVEPPFSKVTNSPKYRSSDVSGSESNKGISNNNVKSSNISEEVTKNNNASSSTSKLTENILIRKLEPEVNDEALSKSNVSREKYNGKFSPQSKFSSSMDNIIHAPPEINEIKQCFSVDKEPRHDNEAYSSYLNSRNSELEPDEYSMSEGIKDISELRNKSFDSELSSKYTGTSNSELIPNKFSSSKEIKEISELQNKGQEISQSNDHLKEKLAFAQKEKLHHDSSQYTNSEYSQTSKESPISNNLSTNFHFDPNGESRKESSANAFGQIHSDKDTDKIEGALQDATLEARVNSSLYKSSQSSIEFLPNPELSEPLSRAITRSVGNMEMSSFNTNSQQVSRTLSRPSGDLQSLDHLGKIADLVDSPQAIQNSEIPETTSYDNLRKLSSTSSANTPNKSPQITPSNTAKDVKILHSYDMSNSSTTNGNPYASEKSEKIEKSTSSTHETQNEVIEPVNVNESIISSGQRSIKIMSDDIITVLGELSSELINEIDVLVQSMRILVAQVDKEKLVLEDHDEQNAFSTFKNNELSQFNDAVFIMKKLRDIMDKILATYKRHIDVLYKHDKYIHGTMLSDNNENGSDTSNKTKSNSLGGICLTLSGDLIELYIKFFAIRTVSLHLSENQIFQSQTFYEMKLPLWTHKTSIILIKILEELVKKIRVCANPQENNSGSTEQNSVIRQTENREFLLGYIETKTALEHFLELVPKMPNNNN